MSTKFRELREEDAFTEAVKKLGGHEKIDDALECILEALSLRPEGFDLVPGWEPIRLAKTVAFTYEGEEIPALRVWFRIVSDELVSLMYVEAVPDSEI
jgi:hypothetical protein